MNLLMQLLRDEHGFVLSAETMLLGTVGVVGATVGLSAVAKSVNDELTDVALAIRSIDQSFHIEGNSGCGACVAGSSYDQCPVEQSLKLLRDDIEKAKAHEQKLRDEAARKPSEKTLDKEGDPQPPTSEKPHERRKKAKKNKKPKNQSEDDLDDVEDMQETNSPRS